MVGEMVSNAVYHHGEGWKQLLSSSTFKRFYTAPSALRWPLEEALSEEVLSRRRLGRAAHAALLQPDVFERTLQPPIVNFATREGKRTFATWLESFDMDVSQIKTKREYLDAAQRIAEQQDTLLLSAEERRCALAMAQSVQGCTDAMEALDGGIYERSFRTAERKARPDCLNGSLLVDVKTTSAFDRFQWQALDLLYPEQLAWYEAVLAEAAPRINVDHWLWVVVETKPYRSGADDFPHHRVKVWVADELLRDGAKERLAIAWEDYLECIRQDAWPDIEEPTETLYGRRGWL